MTNQFEFEIIPRFNEADGLGHINNTVIPVWFEAAREPLFRIFNPTLSLTDWNLIVAGFTINFMAPTRYGMPVMIEGAISRIGNSSLEIRQRCLQQHKLTAEATTTLVHYDYKTEKSQYISDHLRKILLEYAVAP